MAMTSTIDKEENFTTEYVYVLRQIFQIYYGAFGQHLKNGLIGEIGPFFYASSYLDHIDKYWMASNYIAEILDISYVRLEYIFENYKDIKSIPDRIKKTSGIITGPVTYSGKTGITLMPQSEIKIPNEIVPIGIDNVHSLCFFFSFHFFEDLGDNFVIFRRGKPGDLYSFTISLKRF